MPNLASWNQSGTGWAAKRFEGGLVRHRRNLGAFESAGDAARLGAVRHRSLTALVVASICVLGACSHDGRTLAASKPDQTASIVTTSTLDPNATFQLATPFGASTPIQEQYTCKGDNVSPALWWVAVPTGTAELALAMTDSDAKDFIHWVIAGMDPTIVTEIQEGAPADAVQASTTSASSGWGGPCPPAGKTHHYVFTLYALSEPVSTDSGMPGTAALDLIKGSAAAPDVDQLRLPGRCRSMSIGSAITAARRSTGCWAPQRRVRRRAGAVYPDLDDRDMEPETLHTGG